MYSLFARRASPIAALVLLTAAPAHSQTKGSAGLPLSQGGTPLSTSLGMPPAFQWQGSLDAFHDVVLHVQGAIWYDPARRVTIIVYAASSSYHTRDGKLHDNGPALDSLLRAAMGRARIVAASGN